MASGVDTHTHTHTHKHTNTHTHILWRNESDFKKPGIRQPVAGARVHIKSIKCVSSMRTSLDVCILLIKQVLPKKVALHDTSIRTDLSVNRFSS